MKLAFNDVKPSLISKGIMRPNTLEKPIRVRLKLTAKLASAVKKSSGLILVENKVKANQSIMYPTETQQ